MQREIEENIRPMMARLYARLLDDLVQRRMDSPVFRHHIDYVNSAHYTRRVPYAETEPNQIVVDYIAGMTDDYFVDLYTHLFPDSPPPIRYIGYFDTPDVDRL